MLLQVASGLLKTDPGGGACRTGPLAWLRAPRPQNPEVDGDVRWDPPPTCHPPEGGDCETLVEHGLPLWAEPAVGYCSRRPRPSPVWRSRYVGAPAVGPCWVSKSPLVRPPSGATPVPDCPTYLPTCVGVWPPSWWGVLRWGAMCCVVSRPVVCAGAVWPPSWLGVLRWCVAPLMVGLAALGFVVLCCVALCVVPVCGPPYGGACCVGVWHPSWSGVLWWCVAPLMVGRASLACVGCFFWLWCSCCLAGSGGPASRARAVRHPLVLAGSDGPASRARAVRHPVLMFRGCRRPASRVPLFRFLVCARLLAGCWRVFFALNVHFKVRTGPPVVGGCPLLPPPPAQGCAWWVSSSCRCSSLLSVLAGFRCWPPACGCCRRLCPPRSPPHGLVWASLLPAFCCLFSCARTPCCRCSHPAVLAPCPLPYTSQLVLRGCCCPAARFSLCARCLFAAALRLVCGRGSALAVAPPAQPSPPACVSRAALACPLCSLCLLFSGRPSAVCLRLMLPFPPPLVLVSVSLASLPLWLCVSACCFGRTGVRCTLPCCAVFFCPSCVV